MSEPTSAWHFDIERGSGYWYWRLWNRRGDLVMRSHEKYPNPGSAQMAADYEASLLAALDPFRKQAKT